MEIGNASGETRGELLTECLLASPGSRAEESVNVTMDRTNKCGPIVVSSKHC